MYTIKQAAQRTGIGVPLLRAWERRYGIVTPTRTESGYRLYDDEAIDRLRKMRFLVDGGWSPRQAADRVLAGGTIPGPAEPAAATTAVDLVTAASHVDGAAIERALDDMFATGSFERIVEERLYPALHALGDAWERGEVDVAGEHAASAAALRRLGAAFEAAGRGADGPPVLVGLPRGARHELPALAFATALRRAGVRTTYLGADVPLESWLAAVRQTSARCVVIGAPTPADAATASEAVEALRAAHPGLIVAVGGKAASQLPAGLAERLPADLASAVDALGRLLQAS
ncbi:MAG: MerR family transcriptional regulator [Chloroflexi bacterium]|nr:MerR family transcriptional regulator [Chloroflexota bacterium]